MIWLFCLWEVWPIGARMLVNGIAAFNYRMISSFSVSLCQAESIVNVEQVFLLVCGSQGLRTGLKMVMFRISCWNFVIMLITSECGGRSTASGYTAQVKGAALLYFHLSSHFRNFTGAFWAHGGCPLHYINVKFLSEACLRWRRSAFLPPFLSSLQV